MKVTVLTLLLAFVLVIASIVNYSLFVRNNAVSAQVINEETVSSGNTRLASNPVNPNVQSWIWLLPILGLAIRNNLLPAIQSVGNREKRWTITKGNEQRKRDKQTVIPANVHRSRRSSDEGPGEGAGIQRTKTHGSRIPQEDDLMRNSHQG
jgi:hypothetical protein